MKRHFKFLLPLIVVIIFSSCQDVIQIKLDQGSKILVVDAFVTDMRVTQKIRLTYSSDFFNTADPPGASGAGVVLKDLSANKSYTFTDLNNGDYTYNLSPVDTVAMINHTYQLEITFNGAVYTSVTNMKRSTRVDSISVKFQEKNSFNENEGYTCKLWARDVPGPVEDYYWIKSFRNGVLYNKGRDINLGVDGAYSNGADGFLFIPPIAEGITPRGEKFKLGDVCRVEIHSISKETYDFLTQVQTQVTNSGLFATTPENIRTNVTTPQNAAQKGIGWFNMASVGFLERVVN